jgi:AraC-like DNA-binding protein
MRYAGVVLEPVLPLARHPFFRSTDVDEVREVFSKINTPVETNTSGRLPYVWQSNHVVVGPLGLSANWWSDTGGAIAHEVQDIFSLDLPIGDARGEGDHAGETVPYIGNESGILLSPGGPAVARIQAGFAVLEVVVRRGDLEAALTALVGPDARAPLRFAPHFVSKSGVGRSIFELVHYIAAEADRDDSVVSSPLIVASLADSLMFGMLQRLQHNHSGRLATTPRAAEPRHVRRAAEYLEAHAAQPLRLIDLAAVTGVSVRTLQVGFRTHRGCTPMAFLRDRRLGLARAKLLANPLRPITRIAIDCGFEHLGRFSAMYRARFGETPSQTRKRIT